MSTSSCPYVLIKCLRYDPAIDASRFCVVHGMDADDPLFNEPDMR